MTKSIQTVCVITQLSFTSGFKMPHLINFQKALIRNRLHDGVSIRTIALELGVNKSTVLLAKEKLEERGQIERKAGTGRKRVTTADQNHQVIDFIRQNPFQTTITVKEEIEFPGSWSTAWRRIRQSELRSRYAANKFFLGEENKQRRLQFAYEYLQRENNFWDNVVFSDEKTFQSSHNGTLRVYRPKGERYNPIYPKDKPKWSFYNKRLNMD
jgi:transposase